MVLLIHVNMRKSKKWHYHLNSTMALLILYMIMNNDTIQYIFKFHYGTINTVMKQINQEQKKTLNSTMVLLKLNLVLKILKILYNLNSNMVLLIPTSLKKKYTREDVFKFHYGSINTSRRCKCYEVAMFFKFQYGTINTMLNKSKNEVEICFKFHYGTIKTISKLLIAYMTKHLNSNMVLLKPYKK